MTDTLPNVHDALLGAIAALGYVGADGRNANQGFAFRSIDGVVGATRPVLNAAGISLIPSFKSLEQIDYTRSDGKISHRAILEGTFTVRGPAGDSFEFTTIGEAMDTEGRASNKAMSAATKNALIRLFQIGAGDDSDRADDAYHPPAPPQNARSQPQQQAQAPATVGDRIQAAAPRPQAPPPVQQGQDSGELLSGPQGKNLYRLWKHQLGWTKEQWLQQIEIETGVRLTDDRQLTKTQASNLIRSLKILAGEPVDQLPAPAQSDPGPSEDSYFDYGDEPF